MVSLVPCHERDHVPGSENDRADSLTLRCSTGDEDSRPDLSNRYEDYGWPATIVLAADRGEIAKRRGYIPPRPMASMLQAIIDDPDPVRRARGQLDAR
jgi:hypothetical protein